MAAWNPGSYLIREYARHVSAVSATSEKGEPLTVRKTAKDTWEIEGASGGATVRYSVYANELTVRTSHLDATHAFFNGVGLFLYSEESRPDPATLELEVPEGWSVCTGLPLRDGRYQAEDYDHLVDCPVEAGIHERLSFEAEGVPHDIAIWGRGDYDADTLRRDVGRIVETGASMFGGLPYSYYAFLVHLSETRGGGLEHRNSSVLLHRQLGFNARRDYEEFLQLVAHEHFHVWNVKRIKPTAFSPYDYGVENYTRLLWVMEGITDYYAMLIPLRAELISVDRFLEGLGRRITRLARTPGRQAQSLEDSSFDTWIKLYRPDENTVNSTVSYYLKGSLVACVLDLELRARSGDKRSLDTVMRLLFERAGQGRFLDEDELGNLVRDATGVDIEDLLARYVSGTDELRFEEHFARVGIRVSARARQDTRDEGGKPAPEDAERTADTFGWLGAQVRRHRGHLEVASVPTGTPAESAGLYAGDEIVALDGWKVADVAALDARLAEREPGTELELTVFRRARLETVPVTLGRRPRDTFWLSVDPRADQAARERFTAWTYSSPPDNAKS